MKMAPCGIDCEKCSLYLAAFDQEQAASLIPWFKDMGWIKPEEGLEAIQAKTPFCMGCLGDRSVQWSDTCAIRTCCTDERGLAHCAQCPEFICENLEAWGKQYEGHAAMLEKLKGLKE